MSLNGSISKSQGLPNKHYSLVFNKNCDPLCTRLQERTKGHICLLTQPNSGSYLWDTCLVCYDADDVVQGKQAVALDFSGVVLPFRTHG